MSTSPWIGQGKRQSSCERQEDWKTRRQEACMGDYLVWCEKHDLLRQRYNCNFQAIVIKIKFFPVVIPNVKHNNLFFQHDNATPDRMSIISHCLPENRIPTLSWSSRSPDFSPIEYTWHVLVRHVTTVEAYLLPPASLTDLKHRLITQWSLIEESE